jgi:hypothetical protein
MQQQFIVDRMPAFESVLPKTTTVLAKRSQNFTPA